MLGISGVEQEYFQVLGLGGKTHVYAYVGVLLLVVTECFSPPLLANVLLFLCINNIVSRD